MSEQMKWGQRWNINDDGVMVMSDTGSWVENAYYEYLKADNARLKAEVERLRKAGDELLREWSSGDETDARNFKKGLVLWNAAKEGKQS